MDRLHRSKRIANLIKSIESAISEITRSTRTQIPLRKIELILFIMAWMRNPTDAIARRAAFVSSVLTYCWKCGGNGPISELPRGLRHLIARTLEIQWIARAASGDLDGQPFFDTVKSNYSKDDFEPFIIDAYFLRDVVDFLVRAPASHASLNKALFVSCRNEFNEDAHQFHEDTGRNIFNRYRPAIGFLYVAASEDRSWLRNPFELSFIRDVQFLATDSRRVIDFLSQAKSVQTRLSIQMARHMRPEANDVAKRLHGNTRRRSVEDFFGFPHIDTRADPVALSFSPLEPSIGEMLAHYRANARR